MIPAARRPLVEGLRRLDPLGFGVSALSAPMVRETWARALAGFDAPARAMDLRGRTVLLIGSGNVYTALVPWMVLLAEAGATVRVKPATGHEGVARAVAAVTGADVRVWRGGDLAPEADAVRGVDGVVAFGATATIDALRARIPDGVRFLGFGARFGLAVADTLDAGTCAALARDAALYDTEGCMSPAGVLVAEPPVLDTLAAAMADAERRWPRGAIPAEAAAAIRARTMLARALGEAREGPGWAALRLPIERFSPIALPRVLTVYTGADRAPLTPYLPLLGTVAGHAPDLPALRRCALGAMQEPAHDGIHEGVDVLAALSR